MHEDYRYIKALLENDYPILNELYRKLLPKTEALVVKNSGSLQDAFDIFQEALIIIYRKAQQPDFKLTSKFSTFLHGVCWNLCRKRFNKIKTEPLINTPEEGYTHIDLVEETLEDEKRYQLYREKTLELGKECQEIILLFLKKIKAKEIGIKMGYKNENTVLQKHHKCKKQLIKLIHGDERFEE